MTCAARSQADLAAASSGAVLPMKAVRWAAIGVVVLSVALALIFTTRFGEDPNLVPSPLLGQAGPVAGTASAGRQRDLRRRRPSTTRWSS